MRQARCTKCGQMLPLHQMVEADGRLTCADCLPTLGHNAQAAGLTVAVERVFDPTLCCACGKDFGQQELPLHGRFPTCAGCLAALRKRMFPWWLKLMLAVMVAVVAGSIAVNSSYYIAAAQIRLGHWALRRHDVHAAAGYYRAAAQRVPSVRPLVGLADLWDGVDQLQQDHCDQALACLDHAQQMGLPADGIFKQFRQQAEMGVAFDRHDYDRFLQIASQVADENANEPVALASKASALACKYAVTGDEQFRWSALYLLRQAHTKVTPEGEADFADYAQRIHYRLDSRQIINSKEFYARFPNGYHTPDANTPVSPEFQP